MNAGSPSEVNQELLDDFFVEADENLVSIRRGLAQLESNSEKTQPDSRVVENLFRYFHSFKSLSAFVALTPAEAVAHATEDFLRLLRDKKIALTQDGLETLVAATRKLEQIVAAFHSRIPLPQHESILAELSNLCEKSCDSNISGAPAGPAKNDVCPRLPMWKFTFTPSQELDAHGINLNAIREEISKLGPIVKSAPLITGPGKVAFEFFVEMEINPDSFSSWQAKGVLIEKAELENQASSPTFVSPEIDASHNPFLAPSHVIRVDLQRLDELMRITGEMMIHRSRLDAQLGRLNSPAARGIDLRGVQEANGGLGRSLRELSEAIVRVRLIPVAEIFERMPFVLRDLTRQSSKKARLVLAGQDTAIDKYLIERLKEPLLHLVRNAFSHGVETPEERIATNKPEEATIELRAVMSGDSVVLQVGDDGRGIDRDAVMQRAKKLGLEISDSASNSTILKILCSSGFSTRDDADRAAGRGVGMAVVLATMRELGGELALESEEGEGTRFTLRLPLTLAIAETFIISAGGQTYAIPQALVASVHEATESQIQIVNGVEVIPYQSGVLPIVRLVQVFRLQAPPRPKMCVLVIASQRGSFGLLAERILGRREIVVHALRDPLVKVPGISGATELGDGKPVLILDGAALMGANFKPPEPLEKIGASHLLVTQS